MLGSEKVQNPNFEEGPKGKKKKRFNLGRGVRGSSAKAGRVDVLVTARPELGRCR
jgi:hypothetical protein